MTTKSGYCAIIGATNAGKSTLMNAIIGQKVSIVSRKVQTTRCRINGVLTQDDTQIVFVDTPGLFDPKRPLERAMIDEVWGVLHDVDIILLLVDSTNPKSFNDFSALDNILKRCRDDQPLLLALNKCDAVHPKSKLMDLASVYNARHTFDETLMIAGGKGDGVDDVIAGIKKYLPIGPFYYPEDQATDMPTALMAAEITREQVFDRLHQELPYFTMVEPVGLERDDTGAMTIHQNIIVGRDNHKGMVIGKGGVTLKQIGASARAAMEDSFGTRVHLYLHVIVDDKWDQKAARLQAGGLLLH